MDEQPDPRWHEHTVMMRHGDDRDTSHRYGHIDHAHDRPIDLNDPVNRPR